MFQPQRSTTVPGVDEDSQVEMIEEIFHTILFGGDQMTAARARGSQRVRKNSECGRDRLEGLQPVCEDWHAKLCLLGVPRYQECVYKMHYIIHVAN